MKRGCLSRWLPLLCLAGVTLSLPVLAQQPRPKGSDPPKTAAGDGAPATTAAAAPSSTVPLTEDQIKAQQHFQKAKELYQAGSYREAAAELEVARGLDPKAKDLVMNLGIVHEKLGKYDEAVGYFKSYLEMEGVTPAERAKVEGMIKRIEGAKRETPTTPTASATASSSSSAAPAPGTEQERGRVDAPTVIAGSIAIVGLAGGTGLGIYALTSRPGDDFVTGRDGSYATLQQKADDAHTIALVADIGFAVGIVAALATAYLYFGRTKDPNANPTTRANERARGRAAAGEIGARGKGASVSAAPAVNSAGGGLFLRGTF